MRTSFFSRDNLRRALSLLVLCVFAFSQTAFAQTVAEEPPLTDDDRQHLFTPFYDENSQLCNSEDLGGPAGSILVLGDSLTVGMKNQGNLESKLTANRWAVRGIEARNGATVASTISALTPLVDTDGDDVGDTELPPGSAFASGTIVIALGTNTEPNLGPKIGELIRKLRIASPDARIYWMNAYSPTNNNAAYTTVNETIAAQASANNFTVMDWATEAIANPAAYPFSGDNIHHTADGYQSKADFLVRSVGSAAPSVGVGTGTVQLSGANNEHKAWNFFIAAGLSPVQAAGVMGNLAIESGFDPFNQENSQSFGRGGWGLAQWTAGRRITLRDAVIAELGAQYYVATEQAGDMIGGPDEDRLLAFQLQFLFNESNGRTIRRPPMPSPFDTSKYAGISNEWEGLKRTTEIAEATTYWEHNFERPAHAGQQVRIDRAQQIHDRYTGQGGGFDPVTDTGGAGCGGVTDENGGGTTDGADPAADTSDMTCPDGTEDAGVRQDYGPGRVPTVQIRVCNVKGVRQVNASIAQATLSMLTAAEAAGHILTGSSYRSYDDQARLRRQNGCPDVDISPSSSCRVPTARAGSGMHEVALAIDFNNMCFPRSTCPSSPAWNWLMEHASEYGFQKLNREAWHWSPNGQ